MQRARHAILATLGFALLLGSAPLLAQELGSQDFEARRRELREQWKNASSPAEKRAILDEFRKLELMERGEDPSSVQPTEKLGTMPTASDLSRMSNGLAISNSLALGSRLARDGSISDRDVDMLIGLATRDGISDAEKKDLAELRDVFDDTMSAESKKKIDDAVGTDSKFALRTENKTWTTTYFPMAGKGIDDPGDPENNLWAKDGALDRIDSVIEARTGKRGKLYEREKTPWFNGQVGKESGFWIPTSTVREDDAERTTGVDFNGDGKITAGVKHDFLDSRGGWGKDGKTDGTMDTGWFGRCNNVGIAGTLFKEPKHPVTLKGPDGKDVTFSPTMIKGLLALYSDSVVNKGTEFHGERFYGHPDVVTLKNGTRITGDIENAGELDFHGADAERTSNPFRSGDDDYLRLDTKDLEKRGKKIKVRDMATGELKEFEPSEVASIAKEDKDQDIEARTFHNKLTEWLADGHGGVLEIEPGSQVWNYNVESAAITESKTPPFWAGDRSKLVGYDGPPGNGEITYFETDIKYNGGGSSKNYRYWIEKDDKGNVVNSGWASKNPDFMWRSREHEIDWTEPVPGLPDLDPKLLKELYDKSTGDQPPAPEPARPSAGSSRRDRGGIGGFFRGVGSWFRNLFR